MLGVAAATAVVAALLFSNVVAAEAATKTYAISAALNCGGALFQGSTYRSHTRGPASIVLTQNDWWQSHWSLRMGLRNKNGAQITQTLDFAPSSRTKHSFKTTGGSTTLPTGSLATNSRVNIGADGSCSLFPPSYKGNLTQ
jgi:hypothetical protein